MTLAPDLAPEAGVTGAGVTVAGVTGAAIAEEDDAEASVTWAGNLPEWRLLVAPLGGTFRSAPHVAAADGTSTEVGHVEARNDRRAIIPQWRGAIIEWLVQDGDPVSAGQPLARLLPEGAG
jgi:[acyl-carrier-protein] S-malonyltransferase